MAFSCLHEYRLSVWVPAVFGSMRYHSADYALLEGTWRKPGVLIHDTQRDQFTRTAKYVQRRYLASVQFRSSPIAALTLYGAVLVSPLTRDGSRTVAQYINDSRVVRALSDIHLARRSDTVPNSKPACACRVSKTLEY